MGYSTGFWQEMTAKTKKSSPIKFRCFITFVLGGKNTIFLTIGRRVETIIFPLLVSFDFQPINQICSKKYRGKVWKSVDLFTNVVSLQPVLARK
jgi:hypothetical protein